MRSNKWYRYQVAALLAICEQSRVKGNEISYDYIIERLSRIISYTQVNEAPNLYKKTVDLYNSFLEVDDQIQIKTSDDFFDIRYEGLNGDKKGSDDISKEDKLFMSLRLGLKLTKEDVEFLENREAAKEESYD